MKAKTKLLVVLSGGQDSTTCLAIATDMRSRGVCDEVHAICFDYNQRHSREIQSAKMVAALAGTNGFEVCQVPALAGMSPLTNAGEELETYEDHASMEATIGDRVEKTFVPMRNALFLTLAANRAAAMGATMMMTGVCQADNANYPDCRLEFIQAQEKTINDAMGYDFTDERFISLLTPLMNLSKAESIQQLMRLGVDKLAWLAFSHTAYDGQYPPTGKDHASVLRAYGFSQTSLPDPLVIRAYLEGALSEEQLPATSNYDGFRRDYIGAGARVPLVAAIRNQAETLRRIGLLEALPQG